MSLTSYPQEVAEKTEIELHSDSINGRIEALEDHISYLADAIKSVLQPIPPQPQNVSGLTKISNDPSPQSSLGSKLADSAAHIDRLVSKVVDLKNRCKL